MLKELGSQTQVPTLPKNVGALSKTEFCLKIYKTTQKYDPFQNVILQLHNFCSSVIKKSGASPSLPQSKSQGARPPCKLAPMVTDIIVKLKYVTKYNYLLKEHSSVVYNNQVFPLLTHKVTSIISDIYTKTVGQPSMTFSDFGAKKGLNHRLALSKGAIWKSFITKHNIPTNKSFHLSIVGGQYIAL